jgi:hypothetical protein
MKAGQPRPADELRMSGKEFDRIMSRALQVKPESTYKPKRSMKAKGPRKKTKPRQK